ncbi:MAG: hypothetical protein HFACDABA_00594 [Anaerolineales bacterium]|nr:hypothetical protein [Anaerolineales bacterium]
MRIRIGFSKQGALRYTGHLDLHNLWERAVRRAALPLEYSQGYHPQPKIQFASALPLGFASCAEVMDLWLKEERGLEACRAGLQAALPDGIQILAIEQVDERAPALQTQVVAAEYKITVPAEFASGLNEKAAALMLAASLPRERRGKTYDLRPLVESLCLSPLPLEDEAGVLIFLRLASREGATGRPEEVLDQMGIPADPVRIERTRLIFQG